jgi:AraC-like DNA-binding protein
MTLLLDRDAEAVRRVLLHAAPSMVFPLETTVLSLRVDEIERRVDRSSFALVPAQMAYRIELPSSGALAVATLLVSDELCAATASEYSPEVDRRQLADVIAALRFLPRTRWVDELVHRYVFEQSVCGRPLTTASRFIEAELTKELFFLGREQIEGQARSSVLFEGGGVVARARAFIEEHLFEPFRAEQLVEHCHASESTVLRAFHRELGISPLAYVRQRRLEESLALLESGRYAVTEVAARVGYENPSAFAAAFRQRFGTAPSRIRPAPSPEAQLPPHGSPPIRRPRRRT